jgi:regulator of protease activity HflC (stomatin/prohibitin superfamily)
MLQRLKVLAQSIRDIFRKRDFEPAGPGSGGDGCGVAASSAGLAKSGGLLIVLGGIAGLAVLLYTHPPVQTVGRGEIGVRVNQLTGNVSEWHDGSVFVMPGMYTMRVYSTRDQVYHPQQIASASGPSPLQSVEGLSLGVDLSVRYALDAAQLPVKSNSLPDDIGLEIVEPEVQGLVYKIFARYTVREIFSTKRAEIQQILESELKTRLAADGIVLRAVQLGKVDLPADYRRGMDAMLAEELATEKMRYTLEYKEKHVKEIELEGNAEKVRREKAAEASAREQIIAAQGQEEAMKHVLPFKQKQIEQRQLEAEADKVSRIKVAEGSAQARRVEANGEADARQKLADAEVYRLEKVGKVSTDQMAREGALLTKHPLLVQKTLADKLSDKIQVIITSPRTDGSFLAGNLLGGHKGEAAGEKVADGKTDDSQQNDDKEGN